MKSLALKAIQELIDAQYAIASDHRISTTGQTMANIAVYHLMNAYNAVEAVEEVV